MRKKKLFDIVESFSRCAEPWTTSRMPYGVICVKPLSPLNTMTFVMSIYVKRVWRIISQKNPRNTKWCLLHCGDLFPSVQHISQK